ncbi:hypothetical protein M5K25_003828 [Dendrobium thyrsiflorum]|uniref:Uncharacterized protein n=1 Tax=Dendrobium thyrsiflorum TaxID=117978 RepID=A0ABD0VSI3_DENTH
MLVDKSRSVYNFIVVLDRLDEQLTVFELIVQDDVRSSRMMWTNRTCKFSFLTIFTILNTEELILYKEVRVLRTSLASRIAWKESLEEIVNLERERSYEGICEGVTMVSQVVTWVLWRVKKESGSLPSSGSGEKRGSGSLPSPRSGEKGCGSLSSPKSGEKGFGSLPSSRSGEKGCGSLPSPGGEPLFLPTFRQRQPLPPAENRCSFQPFGKCNLFLRQRTALPSNLQAKAETHSFSNLSAKAENLCPFSPLPVYLKNRPKTDFQVQFRPDRPGGSYIVMYDQFKKCDLIVQTIQYDNKLLAASASPPNTITFASVNQLKFHRKITDAYSAGEFAAISDIYLSAGKSDDNDAFSCTGTKRSVSRFTPIWFGQPDLHPLPEASPPGIALKEVSLLLPPQPGGEAVIKSFHQPGGLKDMPKDATGNLQLPNKLTPRSLVKGSAYNEHCPEEHSSEQDQELASIRPHKARIMIVQYNQDHTDNFLFLIAIDIQDKIKKSDFALSDAQQTTFTQIMVESKEKLKPNVLSICSHMFFQVFSRRSCEGLMAQRPVTYQRRAVQGSRASFLLEKGLKLEGIKREIGDRSCLLAPPRPPPEFCRTTAGPPPEGPTSRRTTTRRPDVLPDHHLRPDVLLKTRRSARGPTFCSRPDVLLEARRSAQGSTFCLRPDVLLKA